MEVLKRLKQFAKGDKVLSWNENTGKLESKTVLNAFRKTTKQIVQIQLANKLIETTPDHPFYVQSKGWVEAGKLNINDKLFDEEHLPVSIVSLKTVDEIVPVYNLEVKDNHTYFAHGILVHNKDCTLNGKITLNGKSYNIINGETVTNSNGRELSPVEVYELAIANRSTDPDSSKSLINSLSNADLIQLADRYYEIFHLNDKTIGTNWTALGNTNNIIETLDARLKQNPGSLTFDDITQLSRIKALFQIDATGRGHIILNVGFGAVGVASELKAIGGASKGVTYSDDLVKAAQELYPNKAGKIELHHPFPKYMGGAEKQTLVPLDAAYHQQITNEFFQYWPKKLPGQPRVYPTEQQAQEIMQKVYSKFPLPGN